jgi:hypothetical protein
MTLRPIVVSSRDSHCSSFCDKYALGMIAQVSAGGGVCEIGEGFW